MPSRHGLEDLWEISHHLAGILRYGRVWRELGEGVCGGASTRIFQTLWVYESQGLGWSFHSTFQNLWLYRSQGLGWSFHWNIPDSLDIWMLGNGESFLQNIWSIELDAKEIKSLNSCKTESGFLPYHSGVGGSLLYHNTSPTPRVIGITAGGNETTCQHLQRHILGWLQERGVSRPVSLWQRMDGTCQAVGRTPSQLSLCFYFFMELLGS